MFMTTTDDDNDDDDEPHTHGALSNVIRFNRFTTSLDFISVELHRFQASIPTKYSISKFL